MDISDLVKLTSKAWALPTLAAFAAGVPGRQAALLRATGASRTAFGQSLDHLRAMRLVERTPGHGHPLRPEYQLSPEGRRLSGPAQEIVEQTQDTAQAALIRRMWVLPLLGVTQNAQSFSALAQMLHPITDRALSQTLQRLQTAGWIHREVDITARPPRATYQACHSGALIGQQALRMVQGDALAPAADPVAKKAGPRPPRAPTLG